MTSSEYAGKPRGLFDGFEGYRTPTDKDYRNVLTKGLVVPDANVLLNLYRYDAQARIDLFAVLEKLGDRLWAPHQVLVEFWRNRASALRDPQHTGENTVTALEKKRQESVEVLRDWSNRIALAPERLYELREVLEQGFTTVKEEITGLISAEDADQARNTNNDPVLKTLESVLIGRVGNPLDAEAHADAVKEGKRRIAEGLPPGYKDRNKDDDLAVGDYLVWEQLLREADKRHRDVLLVTDDVKDDWWRKERGQTRGPRLELVDELRNRAGVRLFMLRPDSLLRHAKKVLEVKVSDKSVQDVERVDRFLKEVLEFKVSDAFVQDVERVDRSFSVDESGGWTPDAVQELLERLSAEAPVQAAVIRLAAENDGFIDRKTVYALGGYGEDRMLRGFTRPPNRIAQEFRDRGIVPNGAVDILKPVYGPAPSDGQARGFRIPEELIPLIRGAAT